jgi:hypothetical protein
MLGDGDDKIALKPFRLHMIRQRAEHSLHPIRRQNLADEDVSARRFRNG